MNKALFLDRDGVINEDAGYVYRQEDFRFINGIFELCHMAQKKGYLLVIITNQAGIARGYYTEDDYRVLNNWMLLQFKERGIEITATYYCPYHPGYGVGRYGQDSPDRKPNPGMIYKACNELDINLSESVLIGDKDSDIEAGRNAGVGRLILLKGRYPYTSSNDVSEFESLFDIELA